MVLVWSRLAMLVLYRILYGESSGSVIDYSVICVGEL